MAMQINIDRSDLLRVKATMAAIGKSANPVMARAINKTLGVTQTFGVGKTAEVLNLTKTRIKKDFKQNKAYSGRVSGSLVAKGDPVGLRSFIGTKTLKSGAVSVKVSRKEKPTHLRHAFIETAKGREHVFERVNYAGRPFKPWRNYARLPDKWRFPLERKTGPRVEDYYGQDSVLRPVMTFAGTKISQNLNSQLDYEWSKLP